MTTIIMDLTLSKFQFCLNHNDVDIVTKGLEKFVSTVISQYDSVESFGYYGLLGSNSFNQDYPLQCNGILSQYLQASPQLEELFTLWDLPHRNDHISFITAQTVCFSLILHCCHENPELVSYVIRRLLRENLESLHEQLLIKQIEVLHSTLGLINCIAKSSKSNCELLFNIRISFETSFLNLLTHSKTISWKSNQYETNIPIDCKSFISYIYLHFLRNGDGSMVQELVGSDVMKKIIFFLLDQPTEVTMIFLNDFLAILRKNANVLSYIHIILDPNSLRRLISIFSHENTSFIASVDGFLTGISGLINSFVRKKDLVYSTGVSSSALNKSVYTFVSNVVQFLSGFDDSTQRKVQLEFLSSFPSLVNKCLNITSTVINEAKTHSQFVSTLHYLTNLIKIVPLDGKLKNSIRNLISGQKEKDFLKSNSHSEGDKTLKFNMSKVIGTLIPVGLSKKDFSKLLSHENFTVQIASLELLLEILRRIKRLFSESEGKISTFSHQFYEILIPYLPDFQSFLHTKTTLYKSLTSLEPSTEPPQEHSALPQDEKTESALKDDFDFNFDTTTEEEEIKNQNPSENVQIPLSPHYRASKTLSILLQVMELYLSIVPSASHGGNFDPLKLLDDYFHWEITQTDEQALQQLTQEIVVETLISILKVLKLMTFEGSFTRWFGKPEDAVKTLNKFIVTEDWFRSEKRTPLAKLFLLSSAVNNKVKRITEMTSLAKTLISVILQKSSLIEGHGELGFELQNEADSWVKALSVRVLKSSLVFDLLLRLSFHWNSPLAMFFENTVNDGLNLKTSYMKGIDQDDKEFDNLLPFSPAATCAILLSFSNFSVFCDFLPKHIVAYFLSSLETSSDENSVNEQKYSKEEARAFFSKYTNGFRCDLIKVLSVVLLHAGMFSRLPSSFSVVLEEAAKKCEITEKDENGFMLESKRIKRVLDLIPDTSEIILDNSLVLSQLDPINTLKEIVESSIETIEYISHLTTLIDDNSGFSKSQVSPTTLVCHFILNSYEGSKGKPLEKNEFVTLFHPLSTVVILSTNPINSSSTLKIFLQNLEVQFKVDLKRAIRVSEKSRLFLTALRYLSLIYRKLGDGISLSEDGMKLSNQYKTSSGNSKSVRTRSNSMVEEMETLVEDCLPCCQMLCDGILAIAPALLSSEVGMASVGCGVVRGGCLKASWFGDVIRNVLCRAVKNLSKKSFALSSKRERRVQFWFDLTEDIVREWKKPGFDRSLDFLEIGSTLYDITGNPELKSFLVEAVLNLNAEEILSRFSADQPYSSRNHHLSPMSTVASEILTFAPLPLLQRTQEKVLQASNGMIPLYSPLFLPCLTKSGEGSSTVKSYSFFDPSLLPLNGPVEDGQTEDSLKNVLYGVCRNIPTESVTRLSWILLHQVTLPFDLFKDHMNIIEMKTTLKSVVSFYSPFSFASEHLKTTVKGLISELQENQILGIVDSKWSVAFEDLFNILSQDEDLQVGLIVVLLKLISHSLKVGNTSREQLCSWILLPLLSLAPNSEGELTERNTECWMRGCYSTVILLLNESILSYNRVSNLEQNQDDNCPEYSKCRIILSNITRLVKLKISGVEKNEFTHLQKDLMKKLNKWIKTFLKTGITDSVILNSLSEIIWSIHSSENTLGNQLLNKQNFLVEVEIQTQLFQVQVLWKLLCSHSKFPEILGYTHQTPTFSAKPSLLRLLLRLTLLRASTQQHLHKEASSSTDLSSEDFFVMNQLIANYTSSMSECDQLSLRIFLLFEKHLNGPPLYSLRPGSTLDKMEAYSAHFSSHPEKIGNSEEETSKVSKPAQQDLLITRHWLFDYFSPPKVYATLAEFPFWRPLSPPAFENNKDPIADSFTTNSWESCLNAPQDSNSAVNEEQLYTPQGGDGRPGAEKIYDPAFLLPSILFALQHHELSVRLLANCGALSLVLVSLCSTHPSVRVVSLAILQRVRTILQRQTSERDAHFKDRPQLVLLLEYVRNSFERGGAEEEVPRIPHSLAMFLGRAALNLLQPAHELYGKINKYLLRRAFCDIKDVPLYDLMVISKESSLDNTDSEAISKGRVTALRMLRDGLVSREDHLNLCRKNAYSRLTLLFPLLARDDPRAGHAVLDLLDRALSSPFSSRYLLERCELLHWVRDLASPLRLATHEQEEEEREETEGGKDPSFKFSLRAIALLRRVVGAEYLKKTLIGSMDGEDAFVVVREVVQGLLKEVLMADERHLFYDFLLQLILCMWDVSFLFSALLIPGSSSTNVSWDLGLLNGLMGLLRRMGGEEMNGLVLSVLGLIVFSGDDVSSLSEEMSECLLDLSFQTLVLGKVETASPNENNMKETITFSIMAGTGSTFTRSSEENQYYLPLTRAEGDGRAVWGHFQRLSYLEQNTLPTQQGGLFLIGLVAKILNKAFSTNGTDTISSDFRKCILRWTTVVWLTYFSNPSFDITTIPIFTDIDRAKGLSVGSTTLLQLIELTNIDHPFLSSSLVSLRLALVAGKAADGGGSEVDSAVKFLEKTVKYLLEFRKDQGRSMSFSQDALMLVVMAANLCSKLMEVCALLLVFKDEGESRDRCEKTMKESFEWDQKVRNLRSFLDRCSEKGKSFFPVERSDHMEVNQIFNDLMSSKDKENYETDNNYSDFPLTTGMKGLEKVYESNYELFHEGEKDWVSSKVLAKMSSSQVRSSKGGLKDTIPPLNPFVEGSENRLPELKPSKKRVLTLNNTSPFKFLKTSSGRKKSM